MDAKSLARIVQIIVKEEVTKIVKKELATMRKQIVAEVKKSIPTQQLVETKPSFDNLEDAVTNALQTERKTPKPQQKQFANDPMLNQILNETAMGHTPQPEEYPTMGGGVMGASSAQGGMSAFRAQMQAQFDADRGVSGVTPTGTPGTATVHEMVPQNVNAEALPDALQKALTRDYSQLVKAMDKKKK
jgi:hypothetical protein